MAEVDAEEQVRQARRELAEHQRRQAVAESEKVRAQSALDAATGLLQEEFGISTLAEARELEKSLTADLVAETAQVRAALKKSGAAGE